MTILWTSFPSTCAQPAYIPVSESGNVSPSSSSERFALLLYRRVNEKRLKRSRHTHITYVGIPNSLLPRWNPFTTVPFNIKGLMIVFSRFHDPFDIVVMNARVRVLLNKRFILKKETREDGEEKNWKFLVVVLRRWDSKFFVSFFSKV